MSVRKPGRTSRRPVPRKSSRGAEFATSADGAPAAGTAPATGAPGDGPVALLETAIAALARGDARAALAAASDACWRAPEAPAAHYAYGQAWLALGEALEAQRAFAAAIREARLARRLAQPHPRPPLGAYPVDRGDAPADRRPDVSADDPGPGPGDAGTGAVGARAAGGPTPGRILAASWPLSAASLATRMAAGRPPGGRRRLAGPRPRYWIHLS